MAEINENPALNDYDKFKRICNTLENYCNGIIEELKETDLLPEVNKEYSNIF